MHFADSNRIQKEKTIRRTMFSGMNLLLIASFIAAPTAIVLLPPLSFAAPLPVPAWVPKILDNLRYGTLSENNIDTLITLKERGGGSLKHLISIINRINELAAQQKISYRLVISLSRRFLNRSKVGVAVTVVDSTGKKFGEYDLGGATNDTGKPLRKILTPMRGG